MTDKRRPRITISFNLYEITDLSRAAMHTNPFLRDKLLYYKKKLLGVYQNVKKSEKE